MDNGYTSYNAHELAADDSFIRYVRQNDEAAVKQWSHWITQHQERKDEVDLAIKLVNAIRFKEPEFEAQDQVWNRIAHTIRQEGTVGHPKIVPMRRLHWSWAAAAAVLIMAGAFYFLRPKHTLIEVSSGASMVHALPDASTVRINAESSIDYNQATFKNNRVVQLRGEAFFEVEKGSSFIVQTEMGQIKVLGTSFNVFARNQILEVHCYTGKVEVTGPKNQSIILTAGQRAEIKQQNLSSDAFDTAVADWRQGAFYYDDDAVGDVFAEIGRQFEITVQCPDHISQRSYTGFFSKKSLDSALYSVCWPLNLDYVINNKTVEIKSRIEN